MIHTLPFSFLTGDVFLLNTADTCIRSESCVVQEKKCKVKSENLTLDVTFEKVGQGKKRRLYGGQV